MILVGRIYRFRGVHSLPGFPEPWCFPHQHDYMIEVVAPGDTDTLSLDQLWNRLNLDDTVDVNERFYPSTVESISKWLLGYFEPAGAIEVTVWEDRQRWGRCSSS